MYLYPNLTLVSSPLQLAVQIIEVCLRTRAHNGGIISVADMLTILRNKKSRALVIKGSKRSAPSASAGDGGLSAEDVHEAVRRVAVLGSAHRVVNMGGADMIVSVPVELDTDHVHLMRVARARGGGFTLSQAARELEWSPVRVAKATDALVREGMCWIDKHTGRDDKGTDDSEVTARDTFGYWIPSVWQDMQANKALLDE
jgi:ESCRT-II complex subunit VPS22